MTRAVFFDVRPKLGFVDAYFAMAVGLRKIVEDNHGFVSVERFKNLQKPGWYLSLSKWKNEDALTKWRCQPDHASAQVCGRNLILEDYRLRVGSEITITDRLNSQLITAFIGSLEEIKRVIPLANGSGSTPRLFESVLDPNRGVLLVDLDINQSAPGFLTKESDLFEINHFSVLRDYGMFDRAQAPQQFI